MIPVKQSTAFETAIGPILDADGVAVTGGVVGDFKIKKTTGAFAALNASATLTHVSAGVYDLVLTTSDLDTVGLCVIAIDDTVNACQSLYLQVLEEVVYDALYAASANTFTGAAGSTKVTGVVLADTVTTLTNLPAITSNWLTAAGTAADFGTEMRTVLHGGDWAADMDANGRHRIVDGTGVGEFDTLSGTVLLRSANEQIFTDLTNGGRLDLIFDDILLDTGTTLEARFTGMTSLTQWLGLLAGKQTGNSTARTEIRATGVGGGTYNEVTDSLENVKDTLTMFQTTEFVNIEGKIDIIDGIVDSILADTGTDGVVVATHTTAAKAEIEQEVDDALGGGTGTSLTAILDRLPAALVLGRMDSSVGAMAANVMTAAATAADLLTELRTYLHGGDWAADMDSLGRHRLVDGTGGGEIDSLSGTVALRAATQASIDAIQAAAASILDDTGTSGVVVAASSKTGYALSATGIDAIWDETVETGATARESLMLSNAGNAGRLSGAGTSEIILRNLANTRDRITAQVNSGNRTSLVYDLGS